eukprot:scaffold40362_cov52-Attheya_sp.AAC.2
MAYRFRVLSSSSLERIGVTLGVVIDIEGAMVSLLLLLIIVCVSGVAGAGRKISRRQKSVRWGTAAHII